MDLFKLEFGGFRLGVEAKKEINDETLIVGYLHMPVKDREDTIWVQVFKGQIALKGRDELKIGREMLEVLMEVVKAFVELKTTCGILEKRVEDLTRES